MAKRHEEAARVEVEGGDVDERTRTTNNDECREATSTDASAPTQNQPSMPPEGREGQATGTTGSAGVRVHQPLGAQTDSPRGCDGATTAARDNAQSAERADSTSADHRQRREDAHVNDRGGSAPGDVESRREVQGGGYDGG